MLSFLETVELAFPRQSIPAPTKPTVLHKNPCRESQSPTQGPACFKHWSLMQYCSKGKSVKPGYQNPYKSHRLTSVQNLFLNQEVPILLKERQLHPVFLCGHLVFIFFFLLLPTPLEAHIVCIKFYLYRGRKKKSAESSILFHILTASEKQLSSKNKTPIKKDVLGANIEKHSL